MQRDISSSVSTIHIPITILDGGLGTTLKDHYDASVDGATRPLWSSHILISDPATLTSVQTAFADAGAEIILTATYQASIEGFSRTENPQDGSIGIPVAEAEKYMRSAVKIARSSFKRKHGAEKAGKVALSLGAYGAVMVPSQEYSGKYDEEHRTLKQLRDWHHQRLGIFFNVKETWREVDMVAFETLPLLVEIEAVRQTMWMTQETAEGHSEPKPFWISCVFPGKDLCLPDGSSVDKIVAAMLGRRNNAAMPFAIGINCTKVGKVTELIREFEDAVGKMIDAKELKDAPALVFYPDGTNGEVYNTSTHEWEVQNPGDALVGIFNHYIFHFLVDQCSYIVPRFLGTKRCLRLFKRQKKGAYGRQFLLVGAVKQRRKISRN